MALGQSWIKLSRLELELSVSGMAGRQSLRACLASMVALALLAPGCLVSFDNWPDPIKASSGGAGGGNGTATGGISPFQSGGAGAAGASTGGASGGTSPTGGAGPTGGTSGQSGVSTIVWLTLEGDQAKSTASPNDSLGINGKFYAYSDSCAAVSFNPLTRCATGILCDVGSQFENWGTAIGFDFVNTGVSGTPANAKLVWNPTAHNVIGVAWHITNLVTSTLQLWMLDMDPSWQGTCTSDTCSIQGPPDGRSQITADGTLYFNSMNKDDWGGSGIVYTYSPALAYSLQFKIPTIIVGAETFQFCVDRLGMIVQQ